MQEELLGTALLAPKQEVEMEVSTRNIMSVEIPKFTSRTHTPDENDIYSYGFAFTSSDLDDAVKSLSDILPDMLRLAECEKSCQLMASEIEKLIVPPDSTLDSELTSYLNEWNHLLDKTAKKNLVEDVNSLIRDYLRKILRTSSPSSFTLERIKELSYTLAKTPALQKIKDQENLQVYIQLYMLRLIKKA